ncbi:MAG: cell division protein FtsZ, partial [Christensenellales bacterium]
MDTIDDYVYSYENSVVKIKVFGVGGGGNNAVNRMVEAGIKSAEFVSVNTDKQILLLSNAKKTIQIGEKLTHGFGAGADPKVGAKAADESRELIRQELEGVDMLFITAGMGGGTGTGACPVIASIANEMGILTIAVVTTPFNFENPRRMKNAMEGINNLRNYVDTLLVVPKQKLLEVLSPDTNMLDAFIEADEVLRKAIQGISDLIVKPALINLDFADVRSIMKLKGMAHMGIGVAEGPDKAVNAVKQAVMSPILDT